MKTENLNEPKNPALQQGAVMQSLFWQGTRFQKGDKVKVIKCGNESFLKHFIEIGSEGEIVELFGGWKNQKAYYVKFNGKVYSEPMCEWELDFCQNNVA